MVSQEDPVRTSSTTELQGLDATQELESKPAALSPVSPNSKLNNCKSSEAEEKDDAEEIERLEERVGELDS